MVWHLQVQLFQHLLLLEQLSTSLHTLYFSLWEICNIRKRTDMPMKILKNKRFLIILLDILLTGFSFCLKPVTLFMFRTGLSECVYYAKGIICPGCGGTRCIYNFSIGNFQEAFRFNPGIFCGIFYVLAIVILLNLDILFNVKLARKTNRFLTDYRVILILVIAFMGFGLSRNFFVDWL